jgi:hypothetical protein
MYTALQAVYLCKARFSAEGPYLDRLRRQSKMLQALSSVLMQ